MRTEIVHNINNNMRTAERKKALKAIFATMRAGRGIPVGVPVAVARQGAPRKSSPKKEPPSSSGYSTVEEKAEAKALAWGHVSKQRADWSRDCLPDADAQSAPPQRN